MTRNKTAKSAPLDSRSSFSAPYLDEYPDIDLFQQFPLDENVEIHAGKPATKEFTKPHRQPSFADRAV